MKYKQKMNDKNGNQVVLFPLEYLNMSQDEGGDTSHVGTYNIDFLGWGSNGRILKCPYYAPCDCRCISGADDYRIWESLKPVRYVDGTLDYICWQQAHDDSPLPVGSVLKQGDIIGHTGTTGNITGDHVHFGFAKGKYDGWEQIGDNYQLKNSIHIYNATAINETILVNGYNYDWRNYDGINIISKKNNFKWVLYARNLRNKRNF